MKIYKISQKTNNSDYDTYDSAIVCAESEEEAKIINPGGYHIWHDNDWYFQFADGKETREDKDDTWARPEHIKIEYLGEAKDGLKKGVILASFNAG